jgi:hypothetical protein
MLVGFLTTVSLLLCAISIIAFRRDRSLKFGLLALILGFLAVKNGMLSIIYLLEIDMEITPVMFADIIVGLSIIAGMVFVRK